MTRDEILKEFDTGVLDDTADDLADEVVRLRERIAAVEAQRESVSSQLWDCMNELEGWKHRADRAECILAALREPSEKLLGEVDRQLFAQPSVKGVFFSRAIRAAVAAAEREVDA